MTPIEIINKLDKELSYVNAPREAHFHIQSIIDENRNLITQHIRAEREKVQQKEQPKTT